MYTSCLILRRIMRTKQKIKKGGQCAVITLCTLLVVLLVFVHTWCKICAAHLFVCTVGEVSSELEFPVNWRSIWTWEKFHVNWKKVSWHSCELVKAQCLGHTLIQNSHLVRIPCQSSLQYRWQGRYGLNWQPSSRPNGPGGLKPGFGGSKYVVCSCSQGVRQTEVCPGPYRPTEPVTYGWNHIEYG
jgi:hypothetical protein